MADELHSRRVRRQFPVVSTLSLMAFALLTAFLWEGKSVAAIQITDFKIEAGTMRIVFEDPNGLSNQYSLQQSTGLDANSWTTLPQASFQAIDATHYGFTVPLTNADQEFFKIVGSSAGSAVDPDGDGLLTSLESLLGTSPNLADTDGDGVSDSSEYRYGTSPLDPKNFPTATGLPRVEFAAALSRAAEGSLPTQLTVTFDKPYVGNLRFGVVPSSTALVNVDYLPLPASVPVSGTNAVIPITWLDDGTINPDRVLYLELQTDPALAYVRGGQTRHTVLLQDNDAWWTGILSDRYALRNFQLKVVRVGGTTQVTFVAGAGNDGLPTLEGDSSVAPSSQSVGVIPPGTFPATVQFDAPDHFKITSPEMPASTGGLFSSVKGLTRSLVLEAHPIVQGNIIPGRIMGNYTECLRVADQPPCATQTGGFVIVQQLSGRPSLNQ